MNRIAFNLQDRFVVIIGEQALVITQNGDVFGNSVSGRDIGLPFKFSGAKAAFNPEDRFVVAVGNRLIVTTRNGDVYGHEVDGRNIGVPGIGRQPTSLPADGVLPEIRSR